jgi:hypothetical protein
MFQLQNRTILGSTNIAWPVVRAQSSRVKSIGGC